MNKVSLLILTMLLLFSSCDRSLIQTKNYVGAHKDILLMHLGEAHINIFNGEKGEILVYIINKKKVLRTPNLMDEVESTFIDERNIWSYVVFLVDQDDFIYHTAKQFYRVPPSQMKKLMVDKYG